MKFKDLEIGQKFEIESDGQIIALTKVEEEWREPFCPTNAENEESGGVWVDENQLVKEVKSNER